MEPFLIPAKQPLRISSADFGLLDLSLDACPRSYYKELLASFPDCTEALKMRPSCKVLLILAVHKTSMSMASFSPDTEAEREGVFRKHLELLKILESSLRQPAAASDDEATSFSLLQCLDPISGSAHSAARGAVFSDTDSLLVSLGLHVADVGCCSILRHAEWVYSCFPVVALAVCDEAAARHLHAALKTVCSGML